MSQTGVLWPGVRFRAVRVRRAARRVRAAWARGLIGLLALMLIVVPPGGAVCWPLLNGWHIHIGWTDAAGRPSAGLVVYSHLGPGRVVNPHPTSLSALVAPDTVNLSDLRPLPAGALWLLPLLTLAWLCLAEYTRRRQPEPAPLEHPPKLRLAV
jgi:hypothetical protein